MLGSSLVNALMATGVVRTPSFARLTRGQVLSVSQYAYVEADRALGASDLRTMIRHILPNVSAAPILGDVLDPHVRHSGSTLKR